MRIAILSDIHGNLPALKSVIEDLKDFHPDKIVFAGDFTRGPYPNEVIDLLRALNTISILGNDDLNLLRYMDGEIPEEWRTSKQFGMLRWNVKHISPESLQYLRGLNEQNVIEVPGADPIHVVHGTPRDPFESIHPERDLSVLDLSLNMIAEPVLVCGHTHVPWSLHRNGKLAVNPGAVAGTLTGALAQYARMTWCGEGWRVEIRTIAYDLAPLKDAFEKSGLLAEGGAVARGFLLSMETGYDFMMAFLAYAFEMAERAGYPGCKVIPDEIWDQANETFDFYSVWQDTGKQLPDSLNPVII